ncbi:PREDICTED: double-stranded RNA-binding protein 4-like [Fragaria vesca subsp. vesca]|uniref:double-stranded RNA-binding protein 4-like n=1 Tax=Fragaria vesca subsp. vesca TaxID=101020 RepID=UPI0002C310D5|nr:PREDICTED: double-stranded RNA-binding protein 4-like [Fragaria vesca subsp. vesca]
MCRFVSTLEIGGEYFTGEVARSKKLAEVSAAKVAYNTLRDRKLSHIPLFPTSAIEGQVCSDLLSSKAPSVVAADLQQQMRPNTPIPNSVKREPELEMSVATVGTSRLGTTPSSGVISITVGSTLSGTVHARQPETSRSASPTPQNGSFSTLASDCNSDEDSTLEPPAKRFFSNKVSVHSRMAATLPEDCVVLPLGDENWVDVSPMKSECRMDH